MRKLMALGLCCAFLAGISSEAAAQGCFEGESTVAVVDGRIVSSGETFDSVTVRLRVFQTLSGAFNATLNYALPGGGGGVATANIDSGNFFFDDGNAVITGSVSHQACSGSGQILFQGGLEGSAIWSVQMAPIAVSRRWVGDAEDVWNNDSNWDPALTPNFLNEVLFELGSDATLQLVGGRAG